MDYLLLIDIYTILYYTLLYSIQMFGRLKKKKIGYTFKARAHLSFSIILQKNMVFDTLVHIAQVSYNNKSNYYWVYFIILTQLNYTFKLRFKKYINFNCMQNCMRCQLIFECDAAIARNKNKKLTLCQCASEYTTLHKLMVVYLLFIKAF